jgi:hypothetical protein
MTVKTNNEKQAEFKSWLDAIVEPTALSLRKVPRAGETAVPAPYRGEALVAIREVERLCSIGKFASAARALKAFRLTRPS